MARRSNLPEQWRGGGTTVPFREINRLQRRIDQMFDDIMNTSLPGFMGGSFLPMLGGQETFEQGTQAFLPPCDIEETDNQYLVSFDLPGMRKEDVKIEIRDNQLTVSGERKSERTLGEEGAQGRGPVSRERYYGSFLRSFTLPQDVDPNQVDAVYDNGVLQIAIPKVESRPAGRHISIKEGRLLGGGRPTERVQGTTQQQQAQKQRRPGGGEAA